jgi:hypothetical protein
MPPESADSLSEQGRLAFSQMSWAEAFENLTAADGDAGPGPEDLEMLATTAYMLGHVDPMLGFLERAHRAYLDDAEPTRAPVFRPTPAMWCDT